MEEVTKIDTLTAPCHIAQLPVVREWLQNALETHLPKTLPNDWRGEFLLGASECISNVFRHGVNQTSDKITFHLHQKTHQIELKMHYAGKPFNREAVDTHGAAEDLSEGGYGLMLIERLFCEVEYRTQDAEALLICLRKKLPN